MQFPPPPPPQHFAPPPPPNMSFGGAPPGPPSEFCFTRWKIWRRASFAEPLSLTFFTSLSSPPSPDLASLSSSSLSLSPSYPCTPLPLPPSSPPLLPPFLRLRPRRSLPLRSVQLASDAASAGSVHALHSLSAWWSRRTGRTASRRSSAVRRGLGGEATRGLWRDRRLGESACEGGGFRLQVNRVPIETTRLLSRSESTDRFAGLGRDSTCRAFAFLPPSLPRFSVSGSRLAGQDGSYATSSTVITCSTVSCYHQASQAVEGRFQRRVGLVHGSTAR